MKFLSYYLTLNHVKIKYFNGKRSGGGEGGGVKVKNIKKMTTGVGLKMFVNIPFFGYGNNNFNVI